MNRSLLALVSLGCGVSSAPGPAELPMPALADTWVVLDSRPEITDTSDTSDSSDSSDTVEETGLFVGPESGGFGGGGTGTDPLPETGFFGGESGFFGGESGFFGGESGLFGGETGLFMGTGGGDPVSTGLFPLDSGLESGGFVPATGITDTGGGFIPDSFFGTGAFPPIDSFEPWETGGFGGGSGGTGRPDTDLIDTAVSTLGPSELQEGDIGITELMLDPTCAGGVWFELQNRTNQPIRMRDFTVAWAGVSHPILSTSDFPPVLQVGGSITVHTSSGLDCYDGPARLMIAGDLTPTPDVLTLRGANRVVTRVDFTDHVFPTGQSLGLHPDVRIVDGQESRPGYWCPQVGDLTPTTDQGTPEADNTPCEWATQGTGPGELNVGDLMITELLPLSRDCTSVLNGVYLEVFNTTSSPVRVAGMQVEFRGAIRPVRLLDGPPLLAPNSFGTLALADIDARCPYDLETDFDLLAPVPAINEAVILRGGSTIIDDVGVPASAVVRGLALQLDPSVVLTGDASENDDAALWCSGGPVLPGAANDRGTPGAVNDCSLPDAPVDTDDTDDTVDTVDTVDTIIDTDDTVDTVEDTDGTDTEDPTPPGKTCGCASGRPAGAWWLLGLLAVVGRRRQRD